jgi:CheY-like chemotaxis protein
MPEIDVLVIDDEPEHWHACLEGYAQHVGAGSSHDATYEQYHLRFEFIDSLEGARRWLLTGTRPSGRAGLPHAVLLDVLFPQRGQSRAPEDGLHFLGRLRLAEPFLPVVVVSQQHQNTGQAEMAGRRDADAYVDKTLFMQRGDPDSFEGLLTRIVDLYVMRGGVEAPNDATWDYRDLVSTLEREYDAVCLSHPADVAYAKLETEVLSGLIREVEDRQNRSSTVSVAHIGAKTGVVEAGLMEGDDQGRPWDGRIELVAVEWSASMLERLAARCRGKGWSNGAEPPWLERRRRSPLGFEANEKELFDVILFGGALLSFLSLDEAVREARYALCAGGWLLVSALHVDTPALRLAAPVGQSIVDQAPSMRADPGRGLVRVGRSWEGRGRAYELREIEGALRAQGFEPVDVWRFPTIMAGVGRNELVAGGGEAPGTDPVFPEASGFDQRIYDLDRALARNGMPSGHYLLVAARDRGEVSRE